MFLILLQMITLMYVAELVLYSYAAHRSRKVPHHSDIPFLFPKVSVVVAARDEQEKLPSCLDSLTKLEYPKEMLEIIIVNDQSADSTPLIIDRASKEYSFVKRVDAVENGLLRGKTNALSQGIDKAKGDFIFLTDADCIVPPTWITGSLKYFDEGTGIVGGITLISKTNKSVYGIQALDWDLLLTVGAGAATIGKPIACLGNNLVFRKQAYEEVGSYRKIRFSVTEDYALFNAIAKSRRWNYKFPMDKGTLVYTLPVERMREVFSQRKRWATGGKETGLFGFLTLAPGFLLHWLIILSLSVSVLEFVLFFLIKLVLDSMFVLPTLQYYGKIAHLKFILYFEIYYLIYVAILPFSVYFGKAVTWKGRKY